MNVLVINGSPKGKTSVTLQHTRYLEKCFPSDSFTVLHVGQKIRKYQKDFSEITAEIEKCDLVLFSYPVYTFICPSQLHKFIELCKENKVDFTGKYAAQISTSKHFYDVTAARYIQDNCGDMGLKYIGALCADMDDLLSKKGQREAVDFWKYVRYCQENDIYEKVVSIPAKENKPYERQLFDITAKTSRKKVAVVVDCPKDDVSLKNMIDDFRAIFPFETKLVNLAEFNFHGGCLGCFSCAATGHCIWKDGFENLLRDEIQSCDATVYAFTIKDHSLGSTFKTYNDRQFCNGHRTVTVGAPIGYIINGDLDAEPNLRMVLEGRKSVGENPLAYLAYNTDDMKKEIEILSKKLTYMLEAEIAPTKDFYGVGGMKIFRDLIYVMRGLMKADHKFYKENGIYDFPQKQVGRIVLMQLVGGLMALPSAQKQAKKIMGEAIVMPYQKIIDSAENQEK